MTSVTYLDYITVLLPYYRVYILLANLFAMKLFNQVDIFSYNIH